jgi:ribonuclease P protein component
MERGACLTLRALAGQGRIAFATAKKIGCNPRRNKAKRRAKEATRLLKSPIDRNFDFIVSVSSKAEGVAFPQLQAELEELFSRMSARWASDSESS